MLITRLQLCLQNLWFYQHSAASVVSIALLTFSIKFKNIQITEELGSIGQIVCSF